MEEQLSMFEDNPEYERFVEKFKPKLTTDDCYTPAPVYDAIKEWVCTEYGIDPSRIVRPFWPGADYKGCDYPSGCTVLDNPPFSILSKICEFYLDRDIKFFLFAPSLTAFSGRNTTMRTNHIICDVDITYENGAIVRTAFITNLTSDIVAQSAPTLRTAIMQAQTQANQSKALPKYAYPDHVLTAAMLQKYAHYGVEFCINKQECIPIAALDAQKERGKSIYGGGLLLSNKAAAEKAAAEKVNAIVWRLSEREQGIIDQLGRAKDD